MSSKDKGGWSSGAPRTFNGGYQPSPETKGYKPTPQGRHQPTGHNAPSTPPSNPPNQGSSGKK